MTRLPRNPPTHAPRQRGIVLVVGLVFLLVLTIIGVTALRTTALEERMAGNLQQQTIAFQDAESRVAELINTLNAGTVNLSANDNCQTTIDPETNPDSKNSKAIASFHTCPEFIGTSMAGRLTDTAEGAQTSLLHFRLESTSTTVGNATATVQQGVFQRGPRSPSILSE